MNSSTSKKIYICSTSPSITPKHARHMYSRNSLCHAKFAKNTKFTPEITSDSRNDPQTGQLFLNYFQRGK